MHNTAKIRALNDEFRVSMKGGKVVATRGITMRSDVAAILRKVRAFTEFDQGNDPYGEHDFGSFMHEGEQIFWKIDLYGRQLEMGSPDPADPAVTTRVLTIMLAQEY
jgi:hypothetical protein